MTEGIKHIMTYRQRCEALKFQRKADRYTKLRLVGAIPLSAHMAATEPCLTTTALNAFEWATDILDGHFAKKARRLWPEMPRTEMSKKDPFADKEMQYGNAGAILARSVKKNDLETTLVVGANTAISIWRDVRMAKHRDEARANNINPDAIGINKIKTDVVAVADIVLLSPLANNKTVRRLALGVLSVGTAIGVMGEGMFGQQIDNTIASRQEIEAQHAA